LYAIRFQVAWNHHKLGVTVLSLTLNKLIS
jgi:hypothetical protein